MRFYQYHYPYFSIDYQKREDENIANKGIKFWHNYDMLPLIKITKFDSNYDFML